VSLLQSCIAADRHMLVRSLSAVRARHASGISAAAPAVVDGHVDGHGKCAKTVNLITSTRVSWEGQMVSEVSPGGNTVFL
jgi:hypothetical protein